MPKSNAKNNLPDFSGQTKIMFITEGNPTAMLLTNSQGQRNLTGKKMATAEAALAWCRQNAIMMVYMPLNPAVN